MKQSCSPVPPEGEFQHATPDHSQLEITGSVLGFVWTSLTGDTSAPGGMTRYPEASGKQATGSLRCGLAGRGRRCDYRRRQFRFDSERG